MPIPLYLVEQLRIVNQLLDEVYEEETTSDLGRVYPYTLDSREAAAWRAAAKWKKIMIKRCINCGHDIEAHIEVEDDCDFRCTECGCEAADIGEEY